MSLVEYCYVFEVILILLFCKLLINNGKCKNVNNIYVV